MRHTFRSFRWSLLVSLWRCSYFSYSYSFDCICLCLLACSRVSHRRRHRRHDFLPSSPRYSSCETSRLVLLMLLHESFDMPIPTTRSTVCTRPTAASKDPLSHYQTPTLLPMPASPDVVDVIHIEACNAFNDLQRAHYARARERERERESRTDTRVEADVSHTLRRWYCCKTQSGTQRHHGHYRDNEHQWP